MRVELAALILVASLAVAGGLGYLVGASSVRGVASFPTTATEIPSLELLARVSPQNLIEGQSVTIMAEVYNPLSSSVTLNLTSIVNPSEAQCPLGIYVTGFNIYLGHYTIARLKASGMERPSPLLLYNASVIPTCPSPFHYTYTFQPDGDNATVQSFSPHPPFALNREVNETKVLGGYWLGCCTAGPVPRFFEFQMFQPGQYTVLVFDGWGQQALAYFQVA